MAEEQKSNVGVVLVNDLGLYSSKYFMPLQQLWNKKVDWSYLIINVSYFNENNNNFTPPRKPFDNNWRPPEYGKPLLLIANGQVPPALAEMYKKTYSLDGKFGKIADLGYLCVPDIDKICQYLSSRNPILQNRAMQIMERDKMFIDLTYTALQIQGDIKDKDLREATTKSIFKALMRGLRYIPLDEQLKLPEILVNRTEQLKLAKSSEQKYAEAVQSASKNIYDDGLRHYYQPRTQDR